MPDPRFPTAAVQEYYDVNTEAFVRHGQGGSVGAIHRAVWGPGVSDRAHAFRYVENLIARRLESVAPATPAHVVDLGCGVGASLAYLASERPLRGTGITISPVQAGLGQTRIDSAGLSGRIQVIEGDYCALPPGVADVDLAYAIESFVHGPSPERFFSEAARVLRPGGLLVLCDDVRTGVDGDKAARTLEQFERGWHLNSLLTPSQWQEQAARAGLEHIETTDLTPYLELGRPRDRLIGLLTAVVSRIPFVSVRLAPLIGGSALQRGLVRGWIAYHCAVFRRL